MSEKKRSTYKKGSKLDLPQGIDKAKYGYRWIGQDRFQDNSDGYEERGYEIHKDADGKPVRRGDLLLGRMPIDAHSDRREENEKARVEQTQYVLEKQAAEDEQMAHEFKKKGGKMKFNYSQE